MASYARPVDIKCFFIGDNEPNSSFGEMCGNWSNSCGFYDGMSNVGIAWAIAIIGMMLWGCLVSYWNHFPKMFNGLFGCENVYRLFWGNDKGNGRFKLVFWGN